MIYLASPYTSPDPLIMKTRFLLAEQVTATMLMRGEFAYSPIVHCHELSRKYSIPPDFRFWQRYNFDMLRRADAFYILAIEGWRQSVGLTAEHVLAKELGLPRFFIDTEGYSKQIVD